MNFDELCQRLNVRPDRQGEVYMTCPWCGKEGYHFSFSERGAFCFVCQGKGSINQIAELLLGARVEIAPPPPKPVAAPVDFTAFVGKAAQHPDRVPLWQAYKPVSSLAIVFYNLGVAPLPPHSSQCPHPRLIVPLFAQGNVAGVRARAFLPQDTAPKWLSPKGSRMTLFNGGCIHPSLGACRRELRQNVLYIVENPIDAILLEERYKDLCAVATLGVSMWRPEWTQALARANPRKVICAFDCDRPGNGGGEQGRAAWMETHGKDILPNGIKLVNDLLAAKIKAELFPWPFDTPLHSDLGSFLK